MSIAYPQTVKQSKQTYQTRPRIEIPNKQIKPPALITLGEQIDKYKESHSLLTEKKDIFQYEISRILSVLPFTDIGNAMRFVARFGEVIHFVPEKSAWFVWNNRVWREDDKGYIMGMVRKMLAYIDTEADLIFPPMDEDGQPLLYPQIALGDSPTPAQIEIIKKFEEYDKLVAALKKWGKASQSKKSIDAMLNLCSRQPGIIVSLTEFDANPYLFNCPNGTLNLQTGQLQPHNPKDLNTKISGAIFNPSAPHPEWSKFMLKVTRGDTQTLRTIQQITGEGLAGLQQDDMFPVNFGPGSNGKSVYSEVLKEVMGNYADTAPSDLFLMKQSEGISNDKAALRGVRFLTVSETDEGRRLNEALVKGLTGGDTQKVRFLRQEFFSMTPLFTPMLFTNHKPIITGTDNGIWRRVKLIPWLHNFEKDPERVDKVVVREKMRIELSGILNWIYDGYKDRQAYGKLFISPQIVEETENYRYNSDTMGEFLEDYCITTDKDACVTKKDLYEAYKKFAEESGQDKSKTTTAKGFGMKLRERTDLPFLNERKAMSIRYWTGIRLRNELDASPEQDKAPQTTTENTPKSKNNITQEDIEQFQKFKKKLKPYEDKPSGVGKFTYKELIQDIQRIVDNPQRSDDQVKWIRRGFEKVLNS